MSWCCEDVAFVVVVFCQNYWCHSDCHMRASFCANREEDICIYYILSYPDIVTIPACCLFCLMFTCLKDVTCSSVSSCSMYAVVILLLSLQCRCAATSKLVSPSLSSSGRDEIFIFTNDAWPDNEPWTHRLKLVGKKDTWSLLIQTDKHYIVCRARRSSRRLHSACTSWLRIPNCSKLQNCRSHNDERKARVGIEEVSALDLLPFGSVLKSENWWGRLVSLAV